MLPSVWCGQHSSTLLTEHTESAREGPAAGQARGRGPGPSARVGSPPDTQTAEAQSHRDTPGEGVWLPERH